MLKRVSPFKINTSVSWTYFRAFFIAPPVPRGSYSIAYTKF